LSRFHHADRDTIGGHPPRYTVSRHRRQYSDVLKVGTNQQQFYTSGLKASSDSTTGHPSIHVDRSRV